MLQGPGLAVPVSGPPLYWRADWPGALRKVPLAGWVQSLAFPRVAETTGFFPGSSTAVGFMNDSTDDGAPCDYDA